MPGQTVRHEDKEFTTVKEGLAYILTPPSRDQKEEGKQAAGSEARPTVFYNPIQQFNRDLSVLAIRAYGEHAIASKLEKHERNSARKRGLKRKRQDTEEAEDKEQPKPTEPAKPAQPQEWKPTFTILDALSASGLRALRYAKELPFVTRIIANDLSKSAIESMQLNIQHNRVGNIVQPNNADACSFMYSVLGPQKPDSEGIYFGKFDVVDLDPYGTAAPFFDGAVQALYDGGMLCVTCTDAGVFAAIGYPEKTFALYGGVSLKGAHSHEAGLRLILHAVAMSASKYGLAMEPLLSLSIDFYARLFIRIHKSPAEVKFTAGNTMLVYNCDAGCGAWTTQRLGQSRRREGKNGTPFYSYSPSLGPAASPTCNHCGFKTHLAGPMWAGPLHNPHFIQRILNLLPGADKETYPTIPRIEGMLTTALEEDLDISSDSTDAAPEPGTDTSSSVLIPRVDPAKTEPYPFFFLTSSISRALHCTTLPEDMLRGALLKLGYRSSRSHTKPGSVRTDAPWEVIWEIMREWIRQKSPVKEERLKEGTAAAGLMRRRRSSISGSQDSAAGPDDATKSALRALKRDLLSAVESGRDIGDLTTKIEAALYRSGVKASGATDTAAEDATPSADKGPRATNGKATVPDPSTLEVVFDAALGRRAMEAHRKKRLVRYQANPRPNWGPQTRAPIGN
jgi:tRNA (guanine26-N2/guanine27-N2)-dimethyltransferase